MSFKDECLTFSQHVGTLLLVDEDDDGRVDAGVEDRDELVPLVVFLANVDHLLRPLHGSTHGADVDHHGAPQVVPGQPLHGGGHSSREHHLGEQSLVIILDILFIITHRLSELVLEFEVLLERSDVLGILGVWLHVGHGHVVQHLGTRNITSFP